MFDSDAADAAAADLKVHAAAAGENEAARRRRRSKES
jgi:hypothetical protein